MSRGKLPRVSPTRGTPTQFCFIGSPAAQSSLGTVAFQGLPYAQTVDRTLTKMLRVHSLPAVTNPQDVFHNSFRLHSRLKRSVEDHT